MGEELSLPEVQPVVSQALAGITLVAAALYLDELPMPQVGAQPAAHAALWCWLRARRVGMQLACCPSACGEGGRAGTRS